MKQFELIRSDPHSAARRGRLTTPHGGIQTPCFMPVGTRGSVKGLLPEQIGATGAQIILANTYHLLLRPGPETVAALGGLHGLMGWNGPILTDSGGYQVFSLDALNRITDDGVEFASHLDGAKIYLDPERAIATQNQLGADIIMCFDECPPWPCPAGRLENAVQRTIRWAAQCKAAHTNAAQMLFGIVQGGVDATLRRHCALSLVPMDFDGYAIGGLSVGEGHDRMIPTVRHTAAVLPADKPRYLMGVGMPIDIVQSVRAGVDMFDCVLPTRNGRNAFAFTAGGPLRIRNQQYARDTGPIEAGCPCPACREFSRGAIRHFFNVGEMLGPILMTLHNITYYQRLMTAIRGQIEDGTFEAWADAFVQDHKRQCEPILNEEMTP